MIEKKSFIRTDSFVTAVQWQPDMNIPEVELVSEGGVNEQGMMFPPYGVMYRRHIIHPGDYVVWDEHGSYWSETPESFARNYVQIKPSDIKSGGETVQ